MILITPETSIGNPLYYLYYTETRFLNPHYQSIRPLVEDTSVIQKHSFRISSIPNESAFSPDFQSSKVTATQSKNESNTTANSSEIKNNSRELS